MTGDPRTAYPTPKIARRDSLTYLNKNYAERGQTVLIGDSITEIFYWYELFYAYTKKTGQAVYNRGINGDTSDRLLERLYDNALCIDPKNLVILIGTNDIGLEIPAEVTVGNVEKILQAALAHDPSMHILLTAVWPINRDVPESSAGLRTNEKIAALNSAYALLAKKYAVQWLDYTPALSDRDGDLRADYTYDGLHPNARGCEIAAEQIIPLLRFDRF